VQRNVSNVPNRWRRGSAAVGNRFAAGIASYGSQLSVERFGHFGQQLMSFSNSSISCSMRFSGHDWSLGTLTS